MRYDVFLGIFRRKKGSIIETKTNKSNPLGTADINQLLLKFAVPAIIAMLVLSLYNILDQFFIGNYVNSIGNAATNITFPLTTLCTAISLLFGIGGAAAFNLAMGAGKKNVAGKYVGSAITAAAISGLVLTIISEVFLKKLMLLFGSSEIILPYACEYTRITALGFPFAILSIVGGHVIRADGKPQIAMKCNLAGAFTNLVLDALFVIVFKWGMAGAAAATVIGQMFAAGIALWNVFHFQTVTLSKRDFIPNVSSVLRVSNLGMSQGFNQVAMMFVQIVSNNSFRVYGEQSIYNSEITLAVVGISTKLAMIYFAFCIGLTHAMQPIASFNYGAGNFKRTKEAFTKTRNIGSVIAIIAFLIFQIFPKQLFQLFGESNPLFLSFAAKYMRIFLFFTFINNVQPLTSTFMSAIGKPVKGMFLSLTRQILFLLPLLLILPLFWGIDGLLYAGLIADALAFSVAVIFQIMEFKKVEYK